MPQWLLNEFNIGDMIGYQGAIGECFYVPADLKNDIILIGNSTGAAPLIGITRDALHQGHQGPIHFYHSATTPDLLYLNQTLSLMQQKHDNFYYHACINSETIYPGIQQGRANEIALSKLSPNNKTQMYICGNPEMVAITRKKAFLAGISLKNIFVDPFDYTDLRKNKRG